MKIEEVPQDSRYLQDVSVRDFYYAQDENGEFRKVASVGWEPKNDALSLTWESIMEDAASLREDVLAKKKSPLAYHLTTHLLNVGMLSAYSGIPQKTIKKHLDYNEFSRMEASLLQKYAKTLNMTVEELQQV